MGGHLWYYAVPYQANKQAALDALRLQEFEAGRYFPAQDLPQFPVTAKSPAPGAQHSSIDEALDEAEETGTRSILDFDGFAQAEGDGGIQQPNTEQLLEWFGTAKPTLAQIEDSNDWLEELERGQAYCLTSYAGGQPEYLYFVGYSFD